MTLLKDIFDEEYNQGERLDVVVQDIKVEPVRQGYHPVKLITSRGEVDCHYYPAVGTQQAAVWVGGAGGGWDTPAKVLYPQLCQELVQEAIASLRIRYRYPTRLEECILDVLVGLSYLESEGIKALAITGHSLGGAVAIQAAAISPNVRTIVTLASQSYGAAPVSQLAPRCSILLLHGTDDEILSPQCSQYIYQLAQEPKHLILYPGANHGLDEVAPEVYQVVRDWVIEELRNVAI